VDNCFQQLRNRHRFATLQTHVDKPVEKHERLSMKLRRSAACGALVFPVQIPPLLALLVALAGCGHRKENPVEAAIPTRVITLTPTATEMVVALGAEIGWSASTGSPACRRAPGSSPGSAASPIPTSR